MARTLSIALRARADLDSHRAWLTQAGAGSRGAAKLRALRQAVRELKQAPARWPLDLSHSGLRRRVIGEYVVLYRVTPDTGSNVTAGDVLVLRVLSPGQLALP